jgi:succinate-semialdehyde dehydrogenase
MPADVSPSNGLPSIADTSLIRDEAFIGGDWVKHDGGEVIEVRNPANGELLGTVPALGESDTAKAIAKASEAFPTWRAKLPQERGGILRRWGELLIENQRDLGILMTLEQGKPLTESLGEIEYAASFLEWFGEQGRRLTAESMPSHLPNRLMVVTREPVGVTAAITPWNFPSAMIARKTGAALAAGCTMIVKPSEQTPLCALALAVLGERAGLPKGVLSVVTGRPEAIVEAIMKSTVVRQISFTGSTEVGRILLSQAASTVKRVSMELGGHAPFIVFADADLDLAVRDAVHAKFQTTGQDCLAANRIFIHDAIYAEFAERFSAATLALRVGPGLAPGVQQGPLISEAAVAKCERHISDAVSKGAKILVGGSRHPLGGQFFEPTVLGDVTTDMAICEEETFGPVAPLLRFNSECEVMEEANKTIYGLAGYAYSKDVNRLMRVGRALDFGMIGMNCARMTGAPIPFGGIKQSGLGREGSTYGTDEYTVLKYACFGIEVPVERLS